MPYTAAPLAANAATAPDGMQKKLTVREQGERWLSASLYVLRRRAKARANILYPAAFVA